MLGRADDVEAMGMVTMKMTAITMVLMMMELMRMNIGAIWAEMGSTALRSTGVKLPPPLKTSNALLLSTLQCSTDQCSAF